MFAKTCAVWCAIVGAASMTLATTAAVSPGNGDERTPVIVELFTSEGCSSCPPADTVLQQLVAAQPVAGAEVIALGQHVDYWDALGWKDRFSSAALTNRQRAYSQALNDDSIYTPQLVVDGREELVGSDASAAKKAVARALDAPHGRVRIAMEPSDAAALHVSVTAIDFPPPGRGDRDELIVAVTEDHLQSDVKRGENHGRVLSHAAVVRSLTSLGAATIEAARTGMDARVPIASDWRRENLKIVAFVQESRSRRIVAAAWRPVVAAK